MFAITLVFASPSSKSIHCFNLNSSYYCSVDEFGACQTWPDLYLFILLIVDIAKLLVTPVVEAWKISFLQKWLPVQYCVCSIKQLECFFKQKAQQKSMFFRMMKCYVKVCSFLLIFLIFCFILWLVLYWCFFLTVVATEWDVIAQPRVEAFRASRILFLSWWWFSSIYFIFFYLFAP